MSPTPTPQQQTAIQTLDRALVVEAGAGTGKTWVLVARYLEQLAQHPEWPMQSIVAITFTEKAAREMRNRIREAVEERARAEGGQGYWQERRRQLDQIQVSTIHSLCARILRENAIAAGLDPRFEVLDEEEAGLLAEEAVRQTLAQIGETADHPALALFTTLSIWDVTNTMQDLLGKRGTVQRLFDELESKADLLAKWQAGLAEMRDRAWQQNISTKPALEQALSELPALYDMPSGDKLVPHVQSAQRGIALLAEGNWSGAFDAWNTINLRSGSAKAWGKEELAEIKTMLDALRASIRGLNEKGLLDEIGPLDEDAAQDLHRWQALWQTLTQVYDRLKSERHSLDFDDLERLTVKLLTQPQTGADPRLAAYLTGIHHVMVDEFQDTNPIQQQIVYALAPPTLPGRLFVVGDAKQSIYRFRQAQVSIFNRTAQDVEAASGHPPQPLNRSFRTHQELVNGCNHLFHHLFQPLDGNRHRDYEAQPGPLESQRASGPDAPPIELWLLPKVDAAGEEVNAEEARIWEAHLLADRLLALHREQTPVWDKNRNGFRPFQFKDAAILFRATTSIALYEEVFKQKGLPYLTVSGRGYYDRPEVQDLLALLAALHNPGDDFSLAVVLRSALFGLSDETLYRLRWHLPDATSSPTPRPLETALSDPPFTEQADGVGHACAVLSELWSLAGRVDVWRLLRLALDRTAYETTLALADRAGVGGGRQLSNVQKFLSMAREKGGANLSDFLRRVTDLRAREAREGEALGREPESGAVQLMSIHASKGLEFPVVAVADLGRKARNTSDYLLHDPAFGLVCKVRDAWGEWVAPPSYRWGEWQMAQMEAAESKRLLYVACTRAADRLLLSGQKSNDCWLNQILSVWAIDSQGDEQELWQAPDEAGGYRIAIHRPGIRPPREGSGAVYPAPLYDGLAQMPPRSQPLPSFPSRPAVTVTRFLRDGDSALADNERPPLRPAVRAAAATRLPFHPAPRYLVGNIVHRALADWDLLSLGSGELHDALAVIARGLGVQENASVEDAAARAGRLLAPLQRTALFAQIQQATTRLHEVPFSLSAGAEQLHGTVDLLFADAQGWHLIDWKSEWVGPGQAQAKAQEFLPQLAIYHMAAGRILGIHPRTGVCLLAAGAALHWYTEETLAESLRNLGLADPAD